MPVLLLVCLGLGFGLVLEPAATFACLGLFLLVPFIGATLLRLAGAIEVACRPSVLHQPHLARAPASTLPSYTVLVPLYDEPEVLETLVAGLSALDYPSDRLDIALILEARDKVTIAAARRLALPSHMRMVLVPPGGPRTKPKALNYALMSARSDLVVVFDAEDRPEPDQLRRAAHAFAGAGTDLACVQARLNIYNPAPTYFTRQFTLEYSALFDGLLPALERLGLPIPLGGTSNHFRLATLRAVGAWDPYNVTEDADLGIRLSRMGYRTETIASTTWEEAPDGARSWLGQRTRWLKGWVQTWLVHMRHPGRLLAEAGLWQFLGIQVLMGGVLLSVLVYPIAALGFAVAYLSGSLGNPTGEHGIDWLWMLALGNLAAGIAAPMVAAALAVIRRGRYWLLPSVFSMPFYWLLISIAGYCAIVDYARRPFHWEKTRHGHGNGSVAPQRRRLPPPGKPPMTGRRHTVAMAGHATV
jgi:cellulose synthase/poly-beta-1,6-N-acetylglucosamine synthase-like glycosyltransferase